MLYFILSVLFQYFTILLLPSSKAKSVLFLVLAENHILKRRLDQSHKRVRFSWLQRGLFVHLLSRHPKISTFLSSVSPDTVLRLWKKHIKRFWTYPAALPRNPGRPPITQGVRNLILRIKQKNPCFGYGRIVGVLKLLGIDLSKETVRRTLHNGYQNDDLKPTGSWRRFLSLHWNSLFACDFCTVDTLAFRRFYVFFMLEVQSRRIVQYRITTNPSMSFVRNQLSGFMFNREEEKPVLIHDNSGELKWVDYESLGIHGVATTPYSPNMNAYAQTLYRFSPARDPGQDADLFRTAARHSRS